MPRVDIQMDTDVPPTRFAVPSSTSATVVRRSGRASHRVCMRCMRSAIPGPMSVKVRRCLAPRPGRKNTTIGLIRKRSPGRSKKQLLRSRRLRLHDDHSSTERRESPAHDLESHAHDVRGENGNTDDAPDAGTTSGGIDEARTCQAIARQTDRPVAGCCSRVPSGPTLRLALSPHAAAPSRSHHHRCCTPLPRRSASPSCQVSPSSLPPHQLMHEPCGGGPAP